MDKCLNPAEPRSIILKSSSYSTSVGTKSEADIDAVSRLRLDTGRHSVSFLYMVSNPFGMRSVAQTWCTFPLDFLFGIGIGVRVEPLSTFLDLEFGSGVDIHRIVTGQNCVFFRYAALRKGPDETTGDTPTTAPLTAPPPHQSGHSSRRPVSEVATSVLRPVSSMKTRRAGSRSSWLANQSWRRFKGRGAPAPMQVRSFECPSAPSQQGNPYRDSAYNGRALESPSSKAAKDSRRVRLS